MTTDQPTTNPTSSKKTTVWLDPSALKESGCMLRLFNMLVKGYRGKLNANDIEFGSAFHVYRKSYVTLTHNKEFMHAAGGGAEAEYIAHLKSVAEGLNYFHKAPMYVKHNKKYLTDTYLRETCDGYRKHYIENGEEYEIVTINGTPLVELRVPYPYYTTPEGDIEIILCGTLDKIKIHKAFGFYVVSDYKSTAVWDSRKYFEAYKMSLQMMAYKLLIKKYAELYPDSVIAAIDKSDVKFLIDGIFVGSGKPAVFERSAPISYTASQLKEFEYGLKLIVDRLVYYIRNPKELYREGMLNGSCEKIYGPCSYFDVCAAPNEDEATLLYSTNFNQVPYDPLSHGELKQDKPQ